MCFKHLKSLRKRTESRQKGIQRERAKAGLILKDGTIKPTPLAAVRERKLQLITF